MRLEGAGDVAEFLVAVSLYQKTTEKASLPSTERFCAPFTFGGMCTSKCL